MSSVGKVRIGQKAPPFRCDAVHRGVMTEVTLDTFISDKRGRWLILLFIPAAFSFICPTEVQAFQNCLDEFSDRKCEMVFVSVDTKHSLWHWQDVPRQYGGLGQNDIMLLSDSTQNMSRDCGVLIEEQGVCLKGSFIIDDRGVVQQITLNNLAVGRSVLEALRLLEAFQAVAKHGVLCPVDWRPSSEPADTTSTLSNTLTGSYNDRLANLQMEFGDTVITDLDAKHKIDSNFFSSQHNEGKLKGTKKASNSSKELGDNGISLELDLHPEDSHERDYAEPGSLRLQSPSPEGSVSWSVTAVASPNILPAAPRIGAASLLSAASYSNPQVLRTVSAPAATCSTRVTTPNTATHPVVNSRGFVEKTKKAAGKPFLLFVIMLTLHEPKHKDELPSYCFLLSTFEIPKELTPTPRPKETPHPAAPLSPKHIRVPPRLPRNT